MEQVRRLCASPKVRTVQVQHDQLERALAYHKHCDLSASERWKAIAVMVPGKTVCLLHARRLCVRATRRYLKHAHSEKNAFLLCGQFVLLTALICASAAQVQQCVKRCKAVRAELLMSSNVLGHAQRCSNTDIVAFESAVTPAVDHDVVTAVSAALNGEPGPLAPLLVLDKEQRQAKGKSDVGHQCLSDSEEASDKENQTEEELGKEHDEEDCLESEEQVAEEPVGLDAAVLASMSAEARAIYEAHQERVRMLHLERDAYALPDSNPDAVFCALCLV
jgi:hypothetical protein